MAKVNVEISEELRTKLTEVLPHGTRKAVVTMMLWDLVRLLEGENRKEAVGAILAEAMTYSDFSSAEVKQYADD